MYNALHKTRTRFSLHIIYLLEHLIVQNAAGTTLTFIVQHTDALVAGHAIHARRQDTVVLAAPDDRVIGDGRPHHDARQQRILALCDHRRAARFCSSINGEIAGGGQKHRAHTFL